MPFAKPIEELLPKGTPKDHRLHEIIDQQINRSIPVVMQILHDVGFDTRIYKESDEIEWDFEKKHQVKKPKTEEWDLIHDYFDLPHSPDARTYKLLMQTIERGIGYYEARKKVELRSMVNPISWIAWVIRLPFVILGRAGMEDKNIVVDMYKWLIRIIMFVILILIMTKLGISINWAELIKLIKG